MSLKKLETLEFNIQIDGKVYNSQFTINREAKKEDALAIAAVMQKWLTKSLEALL